MGGSGHFQGHLCSNYGAFGVYKHQNNEKWDFEFPFSSFVAHVELELELIQTHRAQKPVLRVEVGAHALLVRSVSREVAWAGAGVQDVWVGGCRCEAA